MMPACDAPANDAIQSLQADTEAVHPIPEHFLSSRLKQQSTQNSPVAVPGVDEQQSRQNSPVAVPGVDEHQHGMSGGPIRNHVAELPRLNIQS
jgi:hypothetical protein